MIYAVKAFADIALNNPVITASFPELVFLVLVRYAYGFLDFLFTYNLH